MTRQRLTFAVLVSAVLAGALAPSPAAAQDKPKAETKAKAKPKAKGEAKEKPEAKAKTKIDTAKLKAELESKDEARMIAALELAAEAEDPAAAPLVKPLLEKGASSEVIVKAIETAGALKQPSLSAAVASYVKHRSEAVRRAAVKALLKTKGPDAVKALRKALHSQDAQVRGTAASGLGSLGDKDSVPLLFKALEHKVHESAAAIGQLCTPKQCEDFAALTGKHPFDVMSSGFDQILFRPEKEMPEDQKIRVVGRLRELGTKDAGKYLADVQGRWPEDWSKRVKQSIDGAVKATGGQAGGDDE